MTRLWVVIFTGALASCTTPNPAFKNTKRDAGELADGSARDTDVKSVDVSTCNNDGTCDPGEDQKSCPKDCPGGYCGDGTCQPSSETCEICETDCGKCPTKCGNGKCEPGETAASCPADCTGWICAPGQTQCDGKDKIRFCDQGAWKTEACKDLCQSAGYDYSAGCEFSADKQKDHCLCGKYGAFGDLCSEKLKCAPALFCGAFDQNKSGFCTKKCNSPDAACSGAPAGTTAKCILQVQGGYVCGFTCGSGLACPAGMSCDAIDKLCKPK
jgi:hypothetical protein